jgi:hypothetical protein
VQDQRPTKRRHFAAINAKFRRSSGGVEFTNVSCSAGGRHSRTQQAPLLRGLLVVLKKRAIYSPVTLTNPNIQSFSKWLRFMQITR